MPDGDNGGRDFSPTARAAPMTAALPPTPAAHVFRLLTRRRAQGEHLTTSALGHTLARRRAEGGTGLYEVDLPGGQRSWLLQHRGDLVHAVHGALVPEDAADAALRASRHGTVHAFALGDDAAVLALAAVDGRPLSLAEPVGAHEPGLLSDLAAQQFSGVLLLERGITRHHIFPLHGGAPGGAGMGGAALPESTAGYRKTLLAWEPRILPALPYAELVAPQALTLPLAAPQSAEDLWRAFEREVRAELDERAPRLLALLRGQHAGAAPEDLRRILAGHLWRVTGAPGAAFDDPSDVSTLGAARPETP